MLLKSLFAGIYLDILPDGKYSFFYSGFNRNNDFYNHPHLFLQSFLIELIPPKSDRYFALHFGWLMVVLLSFLVRFFIGQTLLSWFFILLVLAAIITASKFFVCVKIKPAQCALGWRILSNRPIQRSWIIINIGLSVFMSAWICFLWIPHPETTVPPVVDSILVVTLILLLPVQSLYYFYNFIMLKALNKVALNPLIANQQKLKPSWSNMLILGYLGPLGLIVVAVVSVALEDITFSGFSYLVVLSYLGVVLLSFYYQKRSVKYAEMGEITEEKIELPIAGKKETYLDLIERLIHLMEEDKLYLVKTLSVQDVASILETNSKYLSAAVNTQLGKGFVTFINEYRVVHAKVLLENPENNHYTLETIGELSGFNSKSSFNAVFKRMEECTPSVYKARQQANA